MGVGWACTDAYVCTSPESRPGKTPIWRWMADSGKGWDRAGDVQRGLYCLQPILPSRFGFKRSLNVTNRRDKGSPHSEDLSGKAQLSCPSTVMLGSSQAGGVLGDRRVLGDEVHGPRSLSPVTTENSEAAVEASSSRVPCSTLKRAPVWLRACEGPFLGGTASDHDPRAG